MLTLHIKDQTKENLELANEYDQYASMCDDYKQVKKIQARNKEILEQLKENGVETVQYSYQSMFGSDRIETIDLTKEL